jgi:uncharacterized membrane protein YciS (DUF1049 family)
MEETINLALASFTAILAIACMAGFSSGVILSAKYMSKRKPRLMRADRELQRLAHYIQAHHPEHVNEEGLVVDKAIDILKETKTPQTWKLQ